MSDIPSKISNTKIPEVSTPNSPNTDFIASERPNNSRNSPVRSEYSGDSPTCEPELIHHFKLANSGLADQECWHAGQAPKSATVESRGSAPIKTTLYSTPDLIKQRLDLEKASKIPFGASSGPSRVNQNLAAADESGRGAASESHNAENILILGSHEHDAYPTTASRPIANLTCSNEQGGRPSDNEQLLMDFARKSDPLAPVQPAPNPSQPPVRGDTPSAGGVKTFCSTTNTSSGTYIASGGKVVDSQLIGAGSKPSPDEKPMFQPDFSLEKSIYESKMLPSSKNRADSAFSVDSSASGSEEWQQNSTSHRQGDVDSHFEPEIAREGDFSGGFRYQSTGIGVADDAAAVRVEKSSVPPRMHDIHTHNDMKSYESL